MGYYDEISRSYNQLHGEEQKKKFNLIKKYIRGRVLDVGCGTGISTPEGGIGIDPSKELLKQNPHKCYLASAENIPFPDKSFDTVICLTSVHNFSDIEKGLREMKRVGKSTFIISVLKKSPRFNMIVAKIKQIIEPDREIDEEKDLILVKT
jgi:ubiquinone/menaquinone biosynthesis C-methylase UbiE